MRTIQPGPHELYNNNFIITLFLAKQVTIKKMKL